MIGKTLQRNFLVAYFLLMVGLLGWAGITMLEDNPFRVSGKSPLCKDCNVILVSLDSLSANHLPCYGYDRNTAPVLCIFAQQNIQFSHAYANGVSTLPSHVSMFTGLNPNIHGVNFRDTDSLSKDKPFLPQILQQNGYTTYFMLPANDGSLPIATVYNRGIDTLLPEESVSWDQALQNFATSVDQHKKTFLFLHTYAVHYPYLIGNVPKLYTTDTYPDIPLSEEEYYATSSEFYHDLYAQIQNALKTETSPAVIRAYKEALPIITQNKFDPEILNPTLLFNNTTKNSNYYQNLMVNIKYNNHFDVHNPRDVQYLRALYDQRIHQMDATQIASVIRFLSSHERIRKSTIVIFTADHGEEFMEHGEIYHITIFDSNLRIPLIFYIPGITKPEHIDTPVQLTDLTPTMLSLLGIPYPNEFQGETLVSEIQGKKLPGRFLVSDGHWLETMVIRTSRWKLHVKRNADKTFTPYGLYDIQADPNEVENVLFSHLNTATDLIAQNQRYERMWRNIHF